MGSRNLGVYLRKAVIVLLPMAIGAAGCSKQSGPTETKPTADKPAPFSSPASVASNAADPSGNTQADAPKFIYETGQPKLTPEAAAANNAWAQQRARAALENKVTELSKQAKAQQDREDFAGAEQTIGQLLAVQTELYGEKSSHAQAARNRGLENRWMASLSPAQRQQLAAATKLELTAETEAPQGHTHEALVAAQKAATIYRNLGGQQTVEYGKLMLFMADKFMLQSDYNLAEQAFRLGLVTIEKTNGPRSPLYARGLLSMSGMYISHGDLVEATVALRQACDLFASTGEDDVSYAYALMTMGVVYKEAGEYRKSIETIQQAMESAQPLGPQGKAIEAECLQHLAGAYFRSKNYSDAERYQLKAMQVMQEAFGETPLLIGCRCRLARIYIKTGQLDQAESILKGAGIAEKDAFGDDSPMASYAMQYLGELYVAKKDYRAAEPLLAKVLAIREKGKIPTHPAIAEVLEPYAVALRGMGRAAEADRIDQRRQTIETNLVAMREQLSQQSGKAVAERSMDRR